MNALRMTLYLVGGALVIGGLVMMYFAAGVDRFVPTTVAVGALLILTGLVVIGLSGRARRDVGSRTIEHHHTVPERDVRHRTEEEREPAARPRQARGDRPTYVRRYERTRRVHRERPLALQEQDEDQGPPRRGAARRSHGARSMDEDVREQWVRRESR